MTDLHAAFIDAFSNYVVDMNMSVEQIEELLVTRGYSPELSFGCFEADRLVGFIYVGSREIMGKQVWYDISTGVVPSLQKQGVGDRMLRKFLLELAGHNVDRFVLEVLIENYAALALYKKHSFQITRRLNCYEAAQSSFTTELSSDYQVDQEPVDLASFDELECNFFAPSWQNSLASWRNVKDKHQVRSLWQNNRMVAYGIVHQQRGRVLQIGFTPQVDRLEATKAIIPLLAQATPADKLVMINVEAGAELEEILKDMEFVTMLDQYEMEFQCK